MEADVCVDLVRAVKDEHGLLLSGKNALRAILSRLESMRDDDDGTLRKDRLLWCLYRICLNAQRVGQKRRTLICPLLAPIQENKSVIDSQKS
jgi:hypothetical protein